MISSFLPTYTFSCSEIFDSFIREVDINYRNGCDPMQVSEATKYKSTVVILFFFSPFASLDKEVFMDRGSSLYLGFLDQFLQFLDSCIIDNTLSDSFTGHGLQ